MSTEDDRRYHTTGDSSSTTQDFGVRSAGSPSFFDDDTTYSNTETTTFAGYDDKDTPPAESAATTPARRGAEWHIGLDIGLLVLRLAVGAFFVAHGTDKLFGWFNDGQGMDATRDMLTGFGFTEPGLLALVLALTESIGGLLVILGLFFPAGAAALLGVMANVIVVKGDWSQFLGGLELELTYAAVAFALLFAGPGRIALDRHTPWWRRAPLFGLVFLVIAAGLSVVTLVVWR